MSTIWSNLFHLADDASMLGPLCTISVFPFENAMRDQQRKVWKPSMDLEQVVRRSFEETRNLKNTHKRATRITVCKIGIEKQSDDPDTIRPTIDQFIEQFDNLRIPVASLCTENMC